jgi:hypothetical protein
LEIGVRTKIEIDDRLMRQAMLNKGTRTKKAAAKVYAQGSIRRLRGKVVWEGDLNQSRLARARE